MAKWLNALSLPSTQPLIVATVNKNYWPVFLNWWVTLALRVNSTLAARVGVVCLDPETRSLFQNISNMHCFPAWNLQRLPDQRLDSHDLFFFRLQLLQQLLQMNRGAIFSDCDALWMRDPLVFYKQAVTDGVDVVASRATEWPLPAVRAWGASLCMGFIMFRPSSGSLVLVKEALSRRDQFLFSDQKAVNMALLERGNLRWNITTRLDRDGPRALAIGMLNNQTKVAITLLTSSEVQRRCLAREIGDTYDMQTVFVMHCYGAPKNGEAKEEQLHVRGLWRLRASWNLVAPRPPLLTYLSRVSSGGGEEPRVPPTPPPPPPPAPQLQQQPTIREWLASFLQKASDSQIDQAVAVFAKAGYDEMLQLQAFTEVRDISQIETTLQMQGIELRLIPKMATALKKLWP